ncbi:MAG: methylmalonyl Co-A mutase-associated GTPase MeaB [Planctomycetota bacterium]
MSEEPPKPTNTRRGRHKLTLDEHYEGVLARDIAVLARTLTLMESSNPDHQVRAEELLTRLMPHTGNSVRVGITGAPGVGKSTFIESFGMHLVEQGHRVAVLAVDPSSGVSGGSILGDKTRMTKLSASGEAYIRPAPSAGTLGGVAARTRESMLVCEAAGFDVVLVETVGVGQSETMVADMTDCFLALMLPGAGDELQGIKRGLLELVDVIAVNKADGEMQAAARRAAHQYDVALKSISGRAHGDDVPEVLTCSALEGNGIAEVWDAVVRRHRALQGSGRLAERRGRQNLRWLWNLVDQHLELTIRDHPALSGLREQLEESVVEGTQPPEAAARQIIDALGLRFPRVTPKAP